MINRDSLLVQLRDDLSVRQSRPLPSGPFLTRGHTIGFARSQLPILALLHVPICSPGALVWMWGLPVVPDSESESQSTSKLSAMITRIAPVLLCSVRPPRAAVKDSLRSKMSPRSPILLAAILLSVPPAPDAAILVFKCVLLQPLHLNKGCKT